MKMKQIVMFLLVLTVTSCEYLEKQEAERKEKEQIALEQERLKQKLIQDSIRIQDSIKIEIEEKKKEERISEIRNSLGNVTFTLSSSNSVGGRDVTFFYTNKSPKIIKYLEWEACFKNAVGDLVRCDVRDYMIYVGKDTGPVKTNHRSGGYWGTVIYNYSATKVLLFKIRIDYIDGSSLEIKGEELKLIGLKDSQIEM